MVSCTKKNYAPTSSQPYRTEFLLLLSVTFFTQLPSHATKHGLSARRDMVDNKVDDMMDDMVDDMVDVYFQPVSPARTVFYPPPFTCNKTWLECPNGNGGQGGRHDGRHNPNPIERNSSVPSRFLPTSLHMQQNTAWVPEGRERPFIVQQSRPEGPKEWPKATS